MNVSQFNIFITNLMILARIKQEQGSHLSLDKKEKYITTQRNSFRTTNFILRKRHTLTHNPEQSPQSKQMTRSPDSKPMSYQSMNPDVERTCSNFMKNYVDKLKKQRKRQKKRLSQMQQYKNSERQSYMGCDIAPLPLIHHGNQQILIFEKINPNTFRSAIIQHIPSADAFQKQKIQQIISQIKMQKEKNQRDLKKRQGLPQLSNSKKKRKASVLKSIGELDPWENEAGHNNNDIFDDFK